MPKVTIKVEIEGDIEDVNDSADFEVYDLEDRVHDAVVIGVQDCGGYDTQFEVDGTYLRIVASGTVDIDIEDDIHEALQDVADDNDIDVSDIDVEYVDRDWTDTFTVHYTFEKETEPQEFEVSLDLIDLQRSINDEIMGGRLTMSALNYLFGAEATNALCGEVA